MVGVPTAVAVKVAVPLKTAGWLFTSRAVIVVENGTPTVCGPMVLIAKCVTGPLVSVNVLENKALEFPEISCIAPALKLSITFSRMDSR